MKVPITWKAEGGRGEGDFGHLAILGVQGLSWYRVGEEGVDPFIVRLIGVGPSSDLHPLVGGIQGDPYLGVRIVVSYPLVGQVNGGAERLVVGNRGMYLIGTFQQFRHTLGGLFILE
jgi:hypothetical protein